MTLQNQINQSIQSIEECKESISKLPIIVTELLKQVNNNNNSIEILKEINANVEKLSNEDILTQFKNLDVEQIKQLDTKYNDIKQQIVELNKNNYLDKLTDISNKIDSLMKEENLTILSTTFDSVYNKTNNFMKDIPKEVLDITEKMYLKLIENTAKELKQHQDENRNKIDDIKRTIDFGYSRLKKQILEIIQLSSQRHNVNSVIEMALKDTLKHYNILKDISEIKNGISNLKGNFDNNSFLSSYEEKINNIDKSVKAINRFIEDNSELKRTINSNYLSIFDKINNIKIDDVTSTKSAQTKKLLEIINNINSKIDKLNINYSNKMANLETFCNKNIDNLNTKIQQQQETLNRILDILENKSNKNNEDKQKVTESKQTKNVVKKLEINSQNVDIYYEQGVINLNLQLYSKAIEKFDEVIEFDPNYIKAYEYRGKIKVHLKKYDEALKDFSKIVELDSSKEQFKKSVEACKIILETTDRLNYNSKDEEAYLERGKARAFLEQYDLAIKDLNKAVEVNPSYAEAYTNRGNIKLKIQEYSKAIKDFKKVITINPKDSYPYNKLIEIYKKIGNNKEAAIYIIELNELQSNK